MKKLVAVLITLAASGCVHFGEAFKLVNSSVLTDAHSANPRSAQDVAVFIGEDVPPDNCERVALLRAADTATVVDRLREEAGRLGANAVDLRDFRNRSADQRVARDNAWNAVALHCPADPDDIGIAFSSR